MITVWAIGAIIVLVLSLAFVATNWKNGWDHGAYKDKNLLAIDIATSVVFAAFWPVVAFFILLKLVA